MGAVGEEQAEVDRPKCRPTTSAVRESRRLGDTSGVSTVRRSRMAGVIDGVVATSR
jgi:hypothetical protein